MGIFSSLSNLVKVVVCLVIGFFIGLVIGYYKGYSAHENEVKLQLEVENQRVLREKEIQERENKDLQDKLDQVNSRLKEKEDQVASIKKEARTILIGDGVEKDSVSGTYGYMWLYNGGLRNHSIPGEGGEAVSARWIIETSTESTGIEASERTGLDEFDVMENAHKNALRYYEVSNQLKTLQIILCKQDQFDEPNSCKEILDENNVEYSYLK